MTDGTDTRSVEGDVQRGEHEEERDGDEEMRRDEHGGGVLPGGQHRSMFGMSSDDAPLITAEITAATTNIIASGMEQTSSEQTAHDVTSDMAELRKEKIRLEHVLFLTNEELDTVREKLYKVNEAENAMKKENEGLLRDRSQRMAAMRELEAERDHILLAKNGCEQKAEMLLRQKEEYEAKIERLNHDKSLLASDMQLQKDEILKLMEKNALLETKVDECIKEKRLIEFEKERWAQEKEIYLHNKDWFMNEIKERDRKFAVLRVEMVRYTGELQAELSTTTDKYESALADIKKLTTTVADREKEISRLNNRIKEVLEDNAQKLNKMEEELLASERLSSVFKEASDDAENNLRQLNEDFENRGRLLEESRKAYESLCSEFEEKRAAFAKEIAEKDKKIADLSDELQKANDLLKSRNRISLTDDEVMELSPAAAAASSLIRSGVSLTGIYREHCRVVSELEEARAENKRIENYFHELVEDIESKAPLLAQQRIEYEKMSDLCSNLQKQLRSAEQEQQRLENARDAATRELTYTRAELERYQRDTEDLGRQVRHLLHVSEVDRARGTESPPMSDEDREMLWTSIGELQKVNQKLMSDLRTANANHDREVEEANSEEISRLTKALNDAIKKLDLLRDQNSKQNMLIEELQKQRDTYKKVGDGRKTPEESQILTKKMYEYESENALLRAQYERAEKSLDLFREEKQRSDEILQGRIDQQYALIAELRKTNGKLEGDIELQKQMQLMLTKQSESDSNELNMTREKYIKLEANYKIVEERSRKLQEELMETKGEVAKYKTDVEALTEQVTLLRSNEARLQQELHVLRESNYSNEKMSFALKQLENRLQHTDEEKIKILEDQLRLAKNENESLKKFVTEISEQHRLISLDLKMTTNKIQTERDQALASKKSAEDRLAWKDKELNELRTKYDDLMNQLKAPDTSLDSTDSGCKKEAQQLRNRNSYLENQLKEVSHRLEVSEKMLAVREQELDEIKKLSSNMETTLVEQGASSVAERNSLQAMLELLKEQLAESVATVEKERVEIARLEQQIREEGNKMEQVKVEKQKEVQELEKRCNSLDIQRANADSRIRELETNIAKIADEKSAVEEERNRLKQNIDKLEQDLHVRENELANAKNSVTEFERKSEDVRRSCASEVAVLRVEKGRTEEELRSANAQIEEQKQKLEALGDNLIKVSERMAFLERSVDASSSSEDIAGPSAGSRSAGALYEVIKYLQGENREAMERMLNAELQWKRLQAQQATADERRIQLEEEIRKLRKEAETHVRTVAEKSEMVARLTMLEGIQKENQNQRIQNEKLTHRCEQLSKSVSELQVRVASLNAEKVTEKGKFQNVYSDLQACRKELESWKERHNQALVSLGKFGPERVVTLTNEIEALKRKINVITTERDSLKKEMEKSVQESSKKEAPEVLQGKRTASESKFAEMSAKFEQARLIARQYRMKSQMSEKEVETLKAQLAEKSAAEEENTAEVTRLKQELLSARTEVEKQKQQKVVPRTGWPTESGAGGATSTSKASSILQTQLKQMEGLNQQNKDLTKQLEELAERYKVAQAKLSESDAKLRELKAESDTKDELRFRLNSITSMLTKKEQEVNRLREELETAKRQLDEYQEKIKTLETALDACRKEVSSRPGISGTPVIAKPVSSTTSVISQSGSPPGGQLPAVNTSGPTSAEPSKEEMPTTSNAMPAGESAATLSAVQTAKHEISKQEESAAAESAEELEAYRSTPVSTTTERSQAVASSSRGSASTSSGRNLFGGVKFGGLATSSPLKSSAPLRWGIDLSSSSSLSDTTHHDTSTSIGTAAPQSNTVSQSSSGGVIQARPQQHNVISGSGDGANVITSSVASGDVLPAAQVEAAVPSQLGSQSVSIGSAESGPSRKRAYAPSSDHSSLIETGSDVLEPRKRQRGSPMEQVSTSGNFMKAGSESRIEAQQHGTEEAEQEQQENVETTTSPEGERSNDTIVAQEADKSTQGADEVGGVGADVGNEAVGERIVQEGGRDEEERVEREHDVLMSDENQGREASADEDNLSEEAGDEMLEEMEEEDDEFDEEEPDEEGDFDLPPHHYRRPPFHSVRPRTHHLGPPGNDDGDDDDVILIEDEDGDDDGEMEERSHSLADLSTDEAHGDDAGAGDDGRKRSAVVDDDVETSTAEARELLSVQGESVLRSEEVAQQSGSSRMDSPSSQTLTGHSTGDDDASRLEHGNSEVFYVPSAELEHSQSRSLDAALQEGGDVVSGSELQAVHDSPPLIDSEKKEEFTENIDSDSRGASSTVAPVTGTDIDSGDSEHGLVIGEEEGDGGNEVAEEEQGDRHAAQTDDEAGSFGPTTSEGSGTRRIRIRYPDITEPTSSSSDTAHQVPGSAQRGGMRGALLRRGRGQRML